MSHHLIFFIIRLDHALAFLGTAVGLMMKPVAVAADAAAALLLLLLLLLIPVVCSHYAAQVRS